MSTLKVNKLRDTSGSTDAIVLDPSGGAVLAGVTTISTARITTGITTSIQVGGGVTISESGIEASGIGITCANINGNQISGRRNLITNGAIQVAQRGTTATCNSGSNTYSMDRWYARGESSLGVFTLSQEDITSNAQGVAYAAKVTVTTNAATPGSGDVYKIAQRIEGQNVAHLELGRATAKPFTLSFSVKSSVTGTHSGSFMNSAQNQSFPFTYTINTADTWEDKVINVPARTSGSWVVNNGIGLELNFDMGSGSGKRGTAGQWAGARAEGATGAVQVISTSSATWFITKVQLEVGSQATAFEHRSYGEELQLCKRYYQMCANSNQDYTGITAFYYSNTHIECMVRYEPELRASPSLDQGTGTDYFGVYSNNQLDQFTGFNSINAGDKRAGSLFQNSGISGTAGHAGGLFINSASAYIAFDAEL